LALLFPCFQISGNHYPGKAAPNGQIFQCPAVPAPDPIQTFAPYPRLAAVPIHGFDLPIPSFIFQLWGYDQRMRWLVGIPTRARFAIGIRTRQFSQTPGGSN
jgi:hypothetical protein